MATGQNLLHWSHWWHLERDSYLRLRERVRASNEIEKGRSALLSTPGIPPSRATIEATVLPVLIDALAGERSDDILTSSLIAAARIGAGDDGSFSGRILAAILPHLMAPSQEVSETAVLALGIYGESSAIAPLIHLARDTGEGSRLVGRGRVPTRTRAFAVIALGLAAHEHDDVTLRQRVALALVEILEADHSTDDVPVAAAIAFGLCPLPLRSTVPEAELRDHVQVDVILSRASQVDWLMERIGPGSKLGSSRGYAWRAHACTALARLAAGLPDAGRAKAMDVLESMASSSAETSPVRVGALIALGEVARSGDQRLDQQARRALKIAMSKGQPAERRLAAISLARAAGRPGDGDDGLAGGAAARRVLVRQLSRGKSGDRPWAAVSLGVLAHALHAANDSDADAAGLALVRELRKQRNASNVGAYAVGCALTCEGSDDKLRQAAGDSALRVLRRISDPAARGHVALALGILRHEPAREDLRTIAEASKFQPSLLWSCSVGLGLLGDEDVTPMLVRSLTAARSSASRAAAASALGHVGDRRAVAPLLELALDGEQPSIARAFAIVGLGVVCDERPLPWRTPIAHALPYVALTSTLSGNAKGILEIL